MILAGLVLFAALAYLHLASRKFAWWKDAAFAGTVTGKEARERDSAAIVPDAQALERPRHHQFYLRIETDDGATAVHQVVPSLFGAVRVGDTVEKKAGTYRARHVPAAGGGRGPPET
ncbi:MAG: DUF7489 domain-containing protein [Planctomycetota bacterium]